MLVGDIPMYGVHVCLGINAGVNKRTIDSYSWWCVPNCKMWMGYLTNKKTWFNQQNWDRTDRTHTNHYLTWIYFFGALATRTHSCSFVCVPIQVHMAEPYVKLYWASESRMVPWLKRPVCSHGRGIGDIPQSVNSCSMPCWFNNPILFVLDTPYCKWVPICVNPLQN